MVYVIECDILIDEENNVSDMMIRADVEKFDR